MCILYLIALVSKLLPDITLGFVSVAAMTATNGVSNGESHNDAGQPATPQPEKGSWTIGLINSRYNSGKKLDRM